MHACWSWLTERPDTCLHACMATPGLGARNFVAQGVSCSQGASLQFLSAEVPMSLLASERRLTIENHDDWAAVEVEKQSEARQQRAPQADLCSTICRHLQIQLPLESTPEP